MTAPASTAIPLAGVRGRLAQFRRRLGVGGRLALWLLVMLRLGLGLLGLVGLMLRRPDPAAGRWGDLTIQGGEPWSLLLSSWQRWDALWYQQISQHGYASGDNTAAFSPLFPLLTWLVAIPLGGHMVWAQLLVASGAFFAAMWLLYRLARLDVGPRAARLTVLLVALFPTGFFLLAPYTEGLYLALTLASFWLARCGRPWAAGLAAAGASLTRLQGFLLALPLAYEYFRQRREQRRRPDLGLAAAALPILAALAQTGYFRWVVGEVRSAVEIQEGAWGYQFVLPHELLATSVAYVLRENHPDPERVPMEALNLVCLVAFSLLALLALRRLPLTYALYTWPFLAILFTRQMSHMPMMSVPRFMLVLFPCFILLALFLARRPWLAAGWLLISTLLHALLADFWMHWGFVA